MGRKYGPALSHSFPAIYDVDSPEANNFIFLSLHFFVCAVMTMVTSNSCPTAYIMRIKGDDGYEELGTWNALRKLKATIFHQKSPR